MTHSERCEGGLGWYDRRTRGLSGGAPWEDALSCLGDTGVAGIGETESVEIPPVTAGEMGYWVEEEAESCGRGEA